MTYLTKAEFSDLGFDDVENFDKLAKRAEIAIDMYTQNIYKRFINFEDDFDYRKQAVACYGVSDCYLMFQAS